MIKTFIETGCFPCFLTFFWFSLSLSLCSCCWWFFISKMCSIQFKVSLRNFEYTGYHLNYRFILYFANKCYFRETCARHCIQRKEAWIRAIWTKLKNSAVVSDKMLNIFFFILILFVLLFFTVSFGFALPASMLGFVQVICKIKVIYL